MPQPGPRSAPQLPPSQSWTRPDPSAPSPGHISALLVPGPHQHPLIPSCIPVQTPLSPVPNRSPFHPKLAQHPLSGTSTPDARYQPPPDRASPPSPVPVPSEPGTAFPLLHQNGDSPSLPSHPPNWTSSRFPSIPHPPAVGLLFPEPAQPPPTPVPEPGAAPPEPDRPPPVPVPSWGPWLRWP